MNLSELTDPLPKPWLNINTNSIETNLLTSQDILSDAVSTDILSIKDSLAVPNPPVGYVSFYSTGSEFKSVDPLGVQKTFATTADVGAYLPLAGGIMSGDITLSSHDLLYVGKVATNNATINIGLNNVVLEDGVVVGADNLTNLGVGVGKCIIYGSTNDISASTNGQSIIYGNDNKDSNTSGGSFIYGFGNTNGTGARNVLIGRNNTIPDGVNEGFVIGFNNTNSISHSLLVGGPNQANIRAGSTICDLGTILNPFRTLYLNGGGYVRGTRPIMSGGYSMVTNTQVGPSSTVETNIIGAGIGSLTSSANSAIVGSSSRMESAGSVTIGAGINILTLRIYGGPTSATLLATYPISLSTLVGAPPPWRMKTLLTMKTLGAGGTVQLNTEFSVNDVSPNQTYVNQTLATIDTTVVNIIRVTAQWTVSNPLNVFITNQFGTNSVYSA